MEYIPLHSLQVQLYYTLYSLALFVFSINRICQNASHMSKCFSSILVLYKTNNECFHSVKDGMFPFNSAVASLNGTFHLSPNENTLTIALINIHYLYILSHSTISYPIIPDYILLKLLYLSHYLSYPPSILSHYPILSYYTLIYTYY
jgi:hypothetical protein